MEQRIESSNEGQGIEELNEQKPCSKKKCKRVCGYN